MEKKGDNSNGYRQTMQRRQKNPFAPSSSSLVSSASQNLLRIPKTINPNKAVFTIDAKTGQILIVNNNACQLLGYTSSELRSKEFFDLLSSKSKSHVCALAEIQFDSENGTMVLLSGKVVEMSTKSGDKIAVSLWIRQIDNDGRCLAVAEPVERHVCHVQIDKFGFITHVDAECLTIFQYESANQLLGLDIFTLIPAIKLPDADAGAIPKNIRKQKATGKTSECITFPLCLLIALLESPNNVAAASSMSEASNATFEQNHGNGTVFDVTIWVFHNLSGLIVTDEFGNIQSCNQHFSLLMFGYTHEKMLNMHISALIPSFCKDNNILESRSRNITNSSLTSEEWEPDTTAAGESTCDKSAPQLNQSQSQSNCNASLENVSQQNDLAPSKEGHRDRDLINEPLTKPPKSSVSQLTICSSRNELDTSSLSVDDILTPVNTCNEFSTPAPTPTQAQQDLTNSSATKLISSLSLESTPSSISTKLLNCADGRYKGEALHADGNVIDVMYEISSQTLSCSRRVYCIWVCRDPDVIFEQNNEKHANLTLTFDSITSTVDQSLGQVIKTTAAQNTSRPNSVSVVSVHEDEQILGDFNKHYTTLKQIGKGAYGFVKMAYRNSDRLLVVTKFILKEKLCAHFMVMDEDKKEVPIEIYILKSVKHPNIVDVLDVFENEHFFQLVMEKHGSGMDLFEFIERRPMMDEQLGCYIFQQIANAVNYLHSLNILHRDIKDENIIIDHNFHVKLIDFGSATFMEDGKLFSTFFGTTEYCSPEVLAGNKYAGPELEVWSLGVTLYVIIFFENPFIDIEETLKADLLMPHAVSPDLENLLYAMLDKDPVARCTMKQLMEDPWLNQEVETSLFNFSCIVPCEPYEANPEKYFTGKLSSSTTALSTVSPQESSSLVDECSIIDNEIDDLRDVAGAANVKSPVEISGAEGSKLKCTVCDRLETSERNGKVDAAQALLDEDLLAISGDASQSENASQRVLSNVVYALDGQEDQTHSLISIDCDSQLDSLDEMSSLCVCDNSSDALSLQNSGSNSSCRTNRALRPSPNLKFSECDPGKMNAVYSLSKMNVSDFSLNRDSNSHIITHFNDDPTAVATTTTNTTTSIITTGAEQCGAAGNGLNGMVQAGSRSQESEHCFLQVEEQSPACSLSSSRSENNIYEDKRDLNHSIYNVASLNDLNAMDPFPNCAMNDASKKKVMKEIFDSCLNEKSLNPY